MSGSNIRWNFSASKALGFFVNTVLWIVLLMFLALIIIALVILGILGVRPIDQVDLSFGEPLDVRPPWDNFWRT